MLDMAAAREAFDGSEDFTVGIEEEFQILDPDTLALAQRFRSRRSSAARIVGSSYSTTGSRFVDWLQASRRAFSDSG